MSDDAKASTILKEMTQSLAVGDFLGVITLDISYLLTYGEPFAKRQAFGLRAIAFEKTGELDRCIGEYEKLLATGDVSVFEQQRSLVVNMHLKNSSPRAPNAVSTPLPRLLR